MKARTLLQRHMLSAGSAIILSACMIASAAASTRAALPSAVELMQHDPSLRACRREASVCIYDSIPTTAIPGLPRRDDAVNLWGSPRSIARVTISGRPFFVISLWSGGSSGASGIMIYEPGNPRHLAAFRDISTVTSSRQRAIGKGAWPSAPFADVFALHYDMHTHTIAATRIGNEANCGYEPHSQADGIEIGECRAAVHRMLDYTYPHDGSSPSVQLFRDTSDYRYEDNDAAFRSPMRVTAHHADATSDTVIFAPQQADARLKSATLVVTYASDLVESVAFRMRVKSAVHEISPEDCINGPFAFPLSEKPEFLSRGNARPHTANAIQSDTIFLFRSEHGFYVVTQLSEQNEPDTPSTTPFQITATITMSKRDR